ncbi:UDP-glucose:undecaprenyl-phosphate glucose-1-phosphate transferase [compost metagenome]
MSSDVTSFNQAHGLPTYHEGLGAHPSLLGIGRASKRMTDFIVAGLGLLAILPILIAIACMIKLDSPGPVIFRQKRVGLNGREFWMYKFRSMAIDAEQRHQALLAQNEMKDGVIFKMTDDPRVTRLGRLLRKTSLDELPQLFNVLRGEMSLVGPRPLPTYEVAQQTPYQMRRLDVVPGCTGLWQTSGRSNLDSFAQMVELDFEYIRNWSFTYDLAILFRTFQVLFKAEGAR